jgi:FSR family fosmidomycin resistance protein-like MFS transporter
MSATAATGPLALRILPVTVAHVAVDLAQSAVPALVPYLVSRFDLSYTQAGGIVLAGTVASSLTQPVFGVLADRLRPRWLLQTGVLVAGLGAASAGVAPSYPVALLLIFAAGLGVAAFHPEAARVARALSGSRRASGMALFSIGGNAGFALGPIVVGGTAAAVGSASGSLVLVPITIIVAGALWALRDRLAEATAAAAKTPAGLCDRWGSLMTLLVGTGLRGYVYFGLLTFVPLYEERVRGRSHGQGELLLALMLVAGVAGSLALGWLGDRVDPRRILAGSFLVVTPAVLLFVHDGGVLGFAALAVTGAALVGTFGLTIVMSQQFLPNRAALAASLSIGFSMGVGGAASLGVGRIADTLGLDRALESCAAVAVAGLCLSLLLPDPGRQ